MWPFRKQVKPFTATKPAQQVFANGINQDSLGKAYAILTESLEKKLGICYISPFQQKQNMRDINDITKSMTSWSNFYEEAPAVFFRENVLRIARLIRRASEYAQGTEYGFSVSQRKRRFLEGVIIGRRCYESWEDLRLALQEKVA